MAGKTDQLLVLIQDYKDYPRLPKVPKNTQDYSIPNRPQKSLNLNPNSSPPLNAISLAINIKDGPEDLFIAKLKLVSPQSGI